MFNLDPGKLLVIAVVAIILLGPDRLPQVARQVGAAWRSFNEFRHRMESEVRSSMPDLPPTSEIARLARSPSALLNHLSSMAPEEEDEAPDGSFQPPAPPAANGSPASTNGKAQSGGPPETEDLPAPAANGAGRPDAVAEPPAEPVPARSQRIPPVTSSPPEVIVPGDPTLN
jgi:sec-independent protein translocase protein TatB